MKAQINGEALPPEGKVNEFSEWVAATATLGDKSEVQFEYRIKLVKKTGMACHYEIEVKNNSDRKLNFGIAFTYYDQLVKRDMKEAVKGKIKPGATGKLKMIAQGCKKKKDAEKSDDYSVCTACGMTYQIVVTE
ncbi:MAG: hypothetical protein LPK45_00860 [Bacteroidota bacterium]|nr:hypothetical protein [Bacteroidota bacterium]MDX5429578.1 hypothetical protein [Bacteroidota bacterium]MDX5468362.1 hypothetical protein [Bacteroidota bacterium]